MVIGFVGKANALFAVITLAARPSETNPSAARKTVESRLRRLGRFVFISIPLVSCAAFTGAWPVRLVFLSGLFSCPQRLQLPSAQTSGLKFHQSRPTMQAVIRQAVIGKLFIVCCSGRRCLLCSGGSASPVSMGDEFCMRNAIRFIYRGARIELSGFDPTRTLLDWLREERRAVGTKEGCNEGDCGACTVVLARLEAGRIVHRPVNACILLLGQVDGAELLTIEDLAQGNSLHPVQEAMVAHHGSQCGFCTPGIVMSLFAAYHEAPRPLHREAIEDCLSGNLCRCTGYRPIVDAALEAMSGPADDVFVAKVRARVEALAEISDTRDIFVGFEDRFFAAPASIEGLAALSQHHSGCHLSRGSDRCRALGYQKAPGPPQDHLARAGCGAGPYRSGAGWALPRRRSHACPRGGGTRRDRSRSRRADAPLRLQAGARFRHCGRQYRQRLADRRSRTGPDRTGREAASATGGRQSGHST